SFSATRASSGAPSTCSGRPLHRFSGQASTSRTPIDWLSNSYASIGIAPGPTAHSSSQRITDNGRSNARITADLPEVVSSQSAGATAESGGSAVGLLGEVPVGAGGAPVEHF